MSQIETSPSNNSLRGIILVSIGLLIIPINDGLAKMMLFRGYEAIEIAWFRYSMIFLLLLGPTLWRYGLASLWPKNPRLHIMRSLALLVSTTSFFIALKWVALADGIAITFAAPLIITMLSGPLLGEKVGLRRWAGVFVGFIGMLIIVRPGVGVFNWGALIALGSACSYGLYFIMTRKAAGTMAVVPALCFLGLVGTIGLSFAVPFVWKTPSLSDLPLLLAIGTTIAFAQLLVIKGLEYIEAALFAPFQYLEIISAVIFGYYVFGEFPDIYTWIGCAIVIVAGLYIAYREQQRKITPP